MSIMLHLLALKIKLTTVMSEYNCSCFCVLLYFNSDFYFLNKSNICAFQIRMTLKAQISWFLGYVWYQLKPSISVTPAYEDICSVLTKTFTTGSCLCYSFSLTKNINVGASLHFKSTCFKCNEVLSGLLRFKVCCAEFLNPSEIHQILPAEITLVFPSQCKSFGRW